MRLFVGIEVDAAVRRETARAIAALRPQLESLDLRWVAVENLHLTVRFIGHVTPERSPPLIAALGQPVTTASFDVTFSGGGRFPARGGPRVLWIGLTRGLADLTALHEEFNRRVEPFGYRPEERPFSAHLTLARVKDASGRDGHRVDDALARVVIGPLAQRVDHVTVFESVLSSRGPRYQRLARLPLAAST